MKSQLAVIISFLCLSIGSLAVWAGAHNLARYSQDSTPVASEYNPPGRGGGYPGGTRLIEQPSHRDYV